MLNTQGSSWKGRDAEPVIRSQDWEQMWLIVCCPFAICVAENTSDPPQPL